MHRQLSMPTVLRSGLLMLALSAASFGCKTDPAAGKTHATVSTPSAGALAVQEAPKTLPGAATYLFTNQGSTFGFTGAKVTAKHEGSFEKFQGTIQVPDGDPAKGQVTLEVETASLKIDPEKLAGHLKTADFFDVEKFPKATFVSTGVKSGGDGGATHTITGNLTLHGVTKTISFPANVKLEGDAVKVTSEFAINRKDFGIVYPGKPDDLIRDDVLIKLDINAKKS